MIAEVGLASIILAFVLAILQCAFGVLGVLSAFKDKVAEIMAVMRRLAFAQAILVSFAMLSLIIGFLTSDFSLWVVTLHSHSAMPWLYKFAATWGHHEGSMLLWVWVLTIMGWCAARQKMSSSYSVVVLGFQAFLTLGFLAFVILTSNPFLRLFPLPLDGQDLNPMLQDISLVLHPPFLYLGYVGYSLVMAHAVAALVVHDPQVRDSWWKWMRPWALWAWIALTIGITLGSFWAYYELGWGGWWFWDPVENASLMPWLAGTGLLHSLRVVSTKQALQRWTIAQAILTFTLSMLGTFLVRSGALSSVHAFALDPKRGLFIIILLALYGGIGFVLLAWWGPRITRESPARDHPIAVVSLEGLLGLNSVIMGIILFTVALGTLYPLIIAAMKLPAVSIGAPYFNTTLQPIAGVLFALVGVGMLWHNQGSSGVPHRLMTAFLLTIMVLLVCVWKAPSPRNLWVSWVGVSLAIWMFVSVSQGFWMNWQYYKASGRSQKWRRLPWGVSLAHVGLAMCIMGIAVDSGWSQSKVVAMAPAEQVSFAGHNIHFDKIERGMGGNYSFTRGLFRVKSLLSAVDPSEITLKPEKRRYVGSTNMITEAAIAENLTYHLYFNLGDCASDGRWTVRMYFHPLVGWIWFGGLVMALGALASLWQSQSSKRIRQLREIAE